MFISIALIVVVALFNITPAALILLCITWIPDIIITAILCEK